MLLVHSRFHYIKTFFSISILILSIDNCYAQQTHNIDNDAVVKPKIYTDSDAADSDAISTETVDSNSKDTANNISAASSNVSLGKPDIGLKQNSLKPNSLKKITERSLRVYAKLREQKTFVNQYMLHDGYIFFVNGNTIQKINADTLEIISNKQLHSDADRNIITCITLSDDKIYVGTHEGNIYTINTDDLSEIIYYKGLCAKQLLIDNGIVYCLDNEGGIYALALKKQHAANNPNVYDKNTNNQKTNNQNTNHQNVYDQNLNHQKNYDKKQLLQKNIEEDDCKSLMYKSLMIWKQTAVNTCRYLENNTIIVDDYLLTTLKPNVISVLHKLSGALLAEYLLPYVYMIKFFNIDDDVYCVSDNHVLLLNRELKKQKYLKLPRIKDACLWNNKLYILTSDTIFVCNTMLKNGVKELTCDPFLKMLQLTYRRQANIEQHLHNAPIHIPQSEAARNNITMHLQKTFKDTTDLKDNFLEIIPLNNKSIACLCEKQTYLIDKQDNKNLYCHIYAPNSYIIRREPFLQVQKVNNNKRIEFITKNV